MFIERSSITVDTDANGDATVYTPAINGLLDSIVYAKGDFADGVDFTITAEDTGETLWSEENVNASVVRVPRRLANAPDMVPLADALAVAIPIRGRIKIVIANGGNAKSGTFHFQTT